MRRERRRKEEHGQDREQEQGDDDDNRDEEERLTRMGQAEKREYVCRSMSMSGPRKGISPVRPSCHVKCHTCILMKIEGGRGKLCFNWAMGVDG